MNNLLDAERAAMKWLKNDYLRSELLRMAVLILQYRRGGSTLCSNDFKAAWACLCRAAPAMDCAAVILGRCLSGDGADGSDDDSSYVDGESESDDMMSVVGSQQAEEENASTCSGSESGMELDEGVIVLGPDSENESDEEEREEGSKKQKVEMSPVDSSSSGDKHQEMAENVSLIANALLESVAPPEAFNQLQVGRFCFAEGTNAEACVLLSFLALAESMKSYSQRRDERRIDDWQFL